MKELNLFRQYLTEQKQDVKEIFFKNQPKNPQEKLKETVDGDTQIISKKDFWEGLEEWADENEDGTYSGYVLSHEKKEDRTYTFVFDIGEVSGFREDDDFIFNTRY